MYPPNLSPSQRSLKDTTPLRWYSGCDKLSQVYLYLYDTTAYPKIIFKDGFSTVQIGSCAYGCKIISFVNGLSNKTVRVSVHMFPLLPEACFRIIMTSELMVLLYVAFNWSVTFCFLWTTFWLGTKPHWPRLFISLVTKNVPRLFLVFTTDNKSVMFIKKSSDTNVCILRFLKQPIILGWTEENSCFLDRTVYL